MSVDISHYLAQTYPSPPCWRLVADVYTRELGLPVTEWKTVSHSVRVIASVFRLALHKGAGGFVQIATPAQWAVVLLGRTPRLGLHHCGVVIDGSVLHATMAHGVLYQDLASLGDVYPMMEFWARAEVEA